MLSFGSPFKPSFFASKWTIRKMPEKYKIAKYSCHRDNRVQRRSFGHQKSAAPMIGGMIVRLSAAASTAPAKSLSYPVFFMIGIICAEPTVLATELPEYMPSITLAMTATFAGPPGTAIELAGQ